MPHLSPIIWLLIPTLILILLYTISYLIYFTYTPLYNPSGVIINNTNNNWYWN